MKVFLDFGHWSSNNCFEIPNLTAPMVEWLQNKFTKIVVSVNSEAELIDIFNKSKEKGVPCAIIEDCGATEFHGVPTKTCCAIGPDEASIIDLITGHLPLL